MEEAAWTSQGLIAWARENNIATPALLFSPGVVRASVGRLRRELGARISYASKANAHPRVLQEMVSLVDEFNVTNVVHLDALLALGVAPRRIAFVHPVVTMDELRAVIQRGVTRVVIDDRRGLRLLRATGVPLEVTLRLLPPDIGESRRSVVRFGNTEEALVDLAHETVSAGFRIEALSFFVGTEGAGMEAALPFRRGVQQVARLSARLAGEDVAVPTINIGGGFPGRPGFHERHTEFFRTIRNSLAVELGPNADVVCEPGRFLCEAAMAMLTRVVADRVVVGRRLVHLDTSAYGGLFETSFIEHDGVSVTIGLSPGQVPARPADVLGHVMDSFDVVKRSALLPPLEEGELLVIPYCGAYSWGYSTRCEGVSDPEVVEVPSHLDAEMIGAS